MELVIEPFIFFVCLSGSQAWSYEGQNEWHQDYPSCAGKWQSPIEINIAKTSFKLYSPLVFANYDIQHNVTITNNGKTVQIDFAQKAKTKPLISGGPLKTGTKYQLENIHFYWGANDTIGSEHVINHIRFPMEVHAVHYNTKYSNFDEAVAYPDGLAVLTVFYHLYGIKPNSGLKRITDVLPSVAHVGASNKIINFQPSHLFNAIDAFKQRVITYKGSLTTPPCLQVVNWLILPKPIAVTASQLKAFRNVKLRYANATGNNWRKLQRTFGRKVYFGIS